MNLKGQKFSENGDVLMSVRGMSIYRKKYMKYKLSNQFYNRKDYSMKKKAKKENMQIPQEIMKQLSNKSIAMIDRVAIGEDYRKENGGTIKDISSFVGISDGMYCKYREVLMSEKGQLIDGIKSGRISLNQAYKLKEADVNSAYFQSFFRYAFIYSLEMQGVEILAERHENILYRSSDGVFLAVVCGNREEKCQVNDEEAIIQFLKSRIESVDIIRSNSGEFYVSSDGVQLKHHIVATVSGISVTEIRRAGVSYKREPYKGIYDLRVSNLTCALLKRIHHPEACGGCVVDRVEDTIRIINETRNQTVIVDYDPWFYNFLRENEKNLRPQSKDDRLSISLNGKLRYVYHVVMAVHFYGVPDNIESLEEKLARFTNDYIARGLEVDHLNADTQDNRLANLMLMTGAQNARKAHMQSEIRKLFPYFDCVAERYDDYSVKMWAVFRKPFHLPVIKEIDVLPVEEFLNEMEELFNAEKQTNFICREFEGLEQALDEMPLK